MDKLTPEELEFLRDAILESAQKFPRGVAFSMLERLIIKGMRIEIPQRGPDCLEAQVLHLQSAGLLESVHKVHTPSAEVWRITKAGDDYLRSK